MIVTQRSVFAWKPDDDVLETLYNSHTQWTCAAFGGEAREGLVCGQADGNLSVLQLRGRGTQTLSGHNGAICSLAMNQNLIASGGSDSSVRLWNTTSGSSATIFQSLESVTALEFSPQSDVLAAAFDSGTLRVWKLLPSPEYSQEPPQTQWEWQLARHRLWIKALAVAPGGNALASGGYDATVRIWALRTGHEMQSFALPHSVSSLAFAPDNRTLCGASERQIFLWDSWTGQPIANFAVPQAVDALHFGADALLTVAAGREIGLWRVL